MNAIGMACILPNYVCNYIEEVEQWEDMPSITKFLKLTERIEYETWQFYGISARRLGEMATNKRASGQCVCVCFGLANRFYINFFES